MKVLFLVAFTLLEGSFSKRFELSVCRIVEDDIYRDVVSVQPSVE
jgi:hypothetical protein